MDFGQKMTRLIKSEGLTQKSFADRIDMSYSHVNKFFTGRKANVDFLEKVLQVFPDTNLNWLLFDEENDEPRVMLREEQSQYMNGNVLKYLDEIEDKVSKLRSVLTQN